MVSVAHPVEGSAVADAASADAPLIESIGTGLAPESHAVIERALLLARGLYGGAVLGTGESILAHAIGMAHISAVLNLDLDSRLAALLFGVAVRADAQMDWQATIGTDFGTSVARLVDGQRRLNSLRRLTRDPAGHGTDWHVQAETLRKMLLAMVEDVRVVLLRLASRTQTLRHLSSRPGSGQHGGLARESLDIYAPLANRLGVWQLKWELEDLSFRFLDPDAYRHIARLLDERRIERESFIDSIIVQLRADLAAAGISADVQGRPKHIYSIWNKMRRKHIGFDEVYDVRAVRVLVNDVRDCYAALSLAHHRWRPIPGEFDDYIAQPKHNDYRSLHTAVMAEDGRPFEVQIRTWEMHRHSELGVAAHWRYKEDSGTRPDAAYDGKIAWLRQLLSWRDEITDGAEWIEQSRHAALNDTIYVLTPQGRVIDLARGATPVDFAYRLHTDIGHRCRGARIDGQLVPLNTVLDNGNRVEIITTKEGGPSRDWLNPAQGYLVTARARQKIRQWFSAQEESALVAQGRSLVTRELQREGQAHAGIESLARTLGFGSVRDLYLAAARGVVGMRALQVVLRGENAATDAAPELPTHDSRMNAGRSGILVGGVGNLLTHFARCCKPVPPDAIAGFVTRGKGVSIHRAECPHFRNLAVQTPARAISVDWEGRGGSASAKPVYAADIVVDARDRQGLLRDISEVLSREKINVTAARTLSRDDAARMLFTIELRCVSQLQRLLGLVREVHGVTDARRR